MRLVLPVTVLMQDVAARELMPRFKHVIAERKHDGSIVTAADRMVEAALAEALPRIFDCPVLAKKCRKLRKRKSGLTPTGAGA